MSVFSYPNKKTARYFLTIPLSCQFAMVILCTQFQPICQQSISKILLFMHIQDCSILSFSIWYWFPKILLHKERDCCTDNEIQHFRSGGIVFGWYLVPLCCWQIRRSCEQLIGRSKQLLSPQNPWNRPVILLQSLLNRNSSVRRLNVGFFISKQKNS